MKIIDEKEMQKQIKQKNKKSQTKTEKNNRGQKL